MTPTEEQEAARSATAQTRQSLMLDSFAGVGKTTTLALMAPGIKVPALALAFNKSIKEELGKRFPSNFKVQSMNGLGYAALIRAHPEINNWVLDDKKVGKLLKSVAKERGDQLDQDSWAGARGLVIKAQMAGLVPDDMGSPLTIDTPEIWKLFAGELFIPDDEQQRIIEIAREVLIQSNILASRGVVSFDDQVYYSVCVQGKFPLYPVLFADEAQDLSPLNHAMISKSMRPDGRLIVAGDQRQSIYQFRGADSDSIAKLKALRGDWQILPLSTTFRCPKVVVRRQQGHAPGYKAAEGNAEGLFQRLGLPTDEGLLPGWGWEDVMQRLIPGGRPAVLCRNNAPLLALAFKLLRRRISITMTGRDIGSGLVTLSKRLFPEDSESADRMNGILDEWELTEVSKASIMNDEAHISAVQDRAESLRAVLSFGEVRDAKELRKAITLLFAQEQGMVTLSTIHRAKGMEWDLVLHLDPWRIPSKRAREEAEQTGDERVLRQEYNLKYVCETRTKHTLLTANLKEFV